MTPVALEQVVGIADAIALESRVGRMELPTVELDGQMALRPGGVDLMVGDLRPW